MRMDSDVLAGRWAVDSEGGGGDDVTFDAKYLKYSTVRYIIVRYSIVQYSMLSYSIYVVCSLYVTFLLPPERAPNAGSRLYCTVMYCTVLYCTVLYCTVL